MWPARLQELLECAVGVCCSGPVIMIIIILLVNCEIPHGWSLRRHARVSKREHATKKLREQFNMWHGHGNHHARVFLILISVRLFNRQEYVFHEARKTRDAKRIDLAHQDADETGAEEVMFLRLGAVTLGENAEEIEEDRTAARFGFLRGV